MHTHRLAHPALVEAVELPTAAASADVSELSDFGQPSERHSLRHASENTTVVHDPVRFGKRVKNGAHLLAGRLSLDSNFCFYMNAIRSNENRAKKNRVPATSSDFDFSSEKAARKSTLSPTESIRA